MQDMDYSQKELLLCTLEMLDQLEEIMRSLPKFQRYPDEMLDRFFTELKVIAHKQAGMLS